MTHTVMHLSSDGAYFSNSLFWQIILFLFFMFHRCVFVFYGECGCICMISICVTDNQRVITDCMTVISMNADLPLLTIWSTCMIWLSSLYDCHARISVWLLTMCDYHCECLAISVFVWQSDVLDIQNELFFRLLFFFLLGYSNIIRIVFF